MTNIPESVFLPLFPLQTVLFPGEKLKLHIFEPRYKQLINECNETKCSFGIPAFLKGKVSEYGTEAVLVTIFHVAENGEMDILTEGRRIFRLLKVVNPAPDKLYPGGDVVFLQDEPDLRSFSRDALRTAFERFHGLLQTGYRRERFDGNQLSFELAQEVGMTTEQKVQLLAVRRENDRLRMILRHLNRVIPILEAMEDVKRIIRKNGKFLRIETFDL